MEVAEKKTILEPHDMLGGYRILGLLGQGGFGITYRALDTKLDLEVAIKEYMPAQIAKRSQDNSIEPNTADEDPMFSWGLTRFIKEAQTLARFNHHNIVRVMAVFELNGTAYMVMEHERGTELKHFFEKPENCNEDTLKKIVGPIIDGLAEVHRQGYIHRDIKPANILIRENGTPVLLDFGSARQSNADQTQALTALVTVGYAPLEQYNDVADKQQGPWTDIYALAAVLYFTITGNPPVASTLRGSAVLNDQPDPLVSLQSLQPAGFSLAFCAAIDWALSFKVSDRPASLSEWRERLLDDDRTVMMPTRRSGADQPSPDPISTKPTDEKTRIAGVQPVHPDRLPVPPRPTEATDSFVQEASTSSHYIHEQPDPPRTPRDGDPIGADEWDIEDVKRENTRQAAQKSGKRIALISGVLALLVVLISWYWYAEKLGESTVSPVSTGETATSIESQVIVQPHEQLRQTEEAEAEALRATEAARLADEQRLAEEARLANEARLEAERASEAARLAEEQRLAEEARLANEARLEAARASEAARLAEEQRVAEEARLANEARLEAARAAEAARLVEEQRLAEQARLAEEARLEAAQFEEAQRAAEAARLVEEQRMAQEASIEAEVAIAVPPAAISDDEMFKAMGQFNRLTRAIEEKNMEAVEKLTVPSQRKYAYLQYLFNTFDDIEVAMVNIRASRREQKIQGTMQIKQMKSSNGNLAFPPVEFRNIPVHTQRQEDWSKVHW